MKAQVAKQPAAKKQPQPEIRDPRITDFTARELAEDPVARAAYLQGIPHTD